MVLLVSREQTAAECQPHQEYHPQEGKPTALEVARTGEEAAQKTEEVQDCAILRGSRLLLLHEFSRVKEMERGSGEGGCFA